MNLTSLYHYTKADSAKEIISGAKIKLSVYPKINDPFDMAKDIIYHPEENIEILYDALSNEKEIKNNRPGISSIFNLDKKTAISKLEEVIKKNLKNGI